MSRIQRKVEKGVFKGIQSVLALGSQIASAYPAIYGIRREEQMNKKNNVTIAISTDYLTRYLFFHYLNETIDVAIPKFIVQAINIKHRKYYDKIFDFALQSTALGPNLHRHLHVL